MHSVADRYNTCYHFVTDTRTAVLECLPHFISILVCLPFHNSFTIHVTFFLDSFGSTNYFNYIYLWYLNFLHLHLIVLTFYCHFVHSLSFCWDSYLFICYWYAGSHWLLFDNYLGLQVSVIIDFNRFCVLIKFVFASNTCAVWFDLSHCTFWFLMFDYFWKLTCFKASGAHFCDYW